MALENRPSSGQEMGNGRKRVESSSTFESKPIYSSWKESSPQLTEEQRGSAELTYSAALIREIHKNTTAQIDSLRNRSIYQAMPDTDIVTERVGGLVEAYIVNTTTKDPATEAPLVIKEKFLQNHVNGEELLIVADEVDQSLTPYKDKVYDKAKKLKPYQMSLKSEYERIKTNMAIGKESGRLMFEPTNTTEAEQQEKTWKGWGSTIRNTVILEGGPHLAGGVTAAISFENIPQLDSPGKVLVAAIGVNAAMWYMMYGPNTDKNIRYLEDTGASIAVASKAAHQAAEIAGKDKEERRKIARKAHWAELTAWEGFYIGESAFLAMQTTPDIAIKYWGGAAAFGLVKNIGVWGAFKAREWKNQKGDHSAEMSAPKIEQIPVVTDTVSEVPTINVFNTATTLTPGVDSKLA
jgi:hypothetical protein